MLKEALKHPPRGKKAESLASRIRALYGNADMNGSLVPIHEDKGMFDIAFAIEYRNFRRAQAGDGDEIPRNHAQPPR